jgi:hypothetical protein
MLYALQTPGNHPKESIQQEDSRMRKKSKNNNKWISVTYVGKEKELKQNSLEIPISIDLTRLKIL